LFSAYDACTKAVAKLLFNLLVLYVYVARVYYYGFLYVF
jgi:hypothetical protein